MVISFMVYEKNEFENSHLKYSRSTLSICVVLDVLSTQYVSHFPKAIQAVELKFGTKGYF